MTIDGPTEILSTVPESNARLRPGQRVRIILELRQAPGSLGEEPSQVDAYLPGANRPLIPANRIDQLAVAGLLEFVVPEWRLGDLAIHPETGEAFTRNNDDDRPWLRIGTTTDWRQASELDDVLVLAKVVPA